jgi:hypothetical protein
MRNIKDMLNNVGSKIFGMVWYSYIIFLIIVVGLIVFRLFEAKDLPAIILLAFLVLTLQHN